MREIKFRAWIKPEEDGEEGLLIYSDTLSDFIMVSNGGKFSVVFDMEDYLKEDEFELMQYTGLKDKNGKEIYEGDIIILESDELKEFLNEPMRLKYGDICKVEWSKTNLAYYLMPINEDVEEQQMDYFGAWSGWNWIKVIGNIYESPELLDE